MKHILLLSLFLSLTALSFAEPFKILQYDTLTQDYKPESSENCIRNFVYRGILFIWKKKDGSVTVFSKESVLLMTVNESELTVQLINGDVYKFPESKYNFEYSGGLFKVTEK